GARGLDAARLECGGEVRAPGDQAQPHLSGGLDDVRRGAAGVAGSGDALRDPERGTRTSTLLPSARAASSSSVNRTAVATVERSAGPASSFDCAAHISSALRPWSGSILLRIAISVSPSYRYWQYPPRVRAARQRSSVPRNPCHR